MSQGKNFKNNQKKLPAQEQEQEQEQIVTIKTKEQFFPTPDEIKKYFDAYETFLKTLKNKLTEGIDYGPPFRGAKNVLLYPGAQKIAGALQLSVPDEYYKIEELKDETGRLIGVRVRLVITNASGTRQIATSAIATWDEKRFQGEGISSTRHTLEAMAYKRAFVKAILIYVGLSGEFAVEEEEEEEIVEIPTKEAPKSFITKSEQEYIINLLKKCDIPIEEFEEKIGKPIHEITNKERPEIYRLIKEMKKG